MGEVKSKTESEMASELFSLNNRIIVVTGALGQLGREYTKALVEAGARVVALDVKLPHAAEFPDEQVYYIAADITSKAALQQALADIQAKWGVPYGLINNAALDSPPDAPPEENGPFETYPESSWEKIMKVNVTGTMLACQVFGGAMAKQGTGAIVNISSIYGMVSPDQSLYEYRRERGEEFYKPVAYSASKSAIHNLTRYLATYWAKQNVRVNTLVLAGVARNQDATFLEHYHKRIPIGRMAAADEYNGTIIYLLSNASSYMTGSTVVVDGGWTAW